MFIYTKETEWVPGPGQKSLKFIQKKSEEYILISYKV